MFTSRAEHRLLLSQNNAEQRLLIKAHSLGLIDVKRKEEFLTKEIKYKEFIRNIKKIKLKKFIDKNKKTIMLEENKTVYELLSRTDADKKSLFKTTKENKHLYHRATIESKYSGYIKKQLREVEKTKKQNKKKIPNNLQYSNIAGLSNEVKEKLSNSKPDTIGSASRMEGVTPAAINLILIQIKKNEILKQNA